MQVVGKLFEPEESIAHYDLTELARQVRDDYFPEQVELPVRWGRRSPRRKRWSIRLGSYDPETTQIRVHPALDAPDVPAWFIQSVIHHEYLHHILGPRHDRRFRSFELRYLYHREAVEWLGGNLMKLLGRRRSPVSRRRRAHVRSLEQARLF